MKRRVKAWVFEGVPLNVARLSETGRAASLLLTTVSWPNLAQSDAHHSSASGA
jgi:hypothetical protein